MIDQPLLALVPKKLEKFNSVDVYPAKPTLPKGDNKMMDWLDIYADLHIGTMLYDNAWVSWPERSYNWEFEVRAAYCPNAMFRGVPPPLSPEDLPSVYNSFVEHLCKSLSPYMGEVLIEKKNKRITDWKSYYCPSTGYYFEVGSKADKNREFNLFVYFSKSVMSKGGHRRVRVCRSSASVHSTGIQISVENFIASIRKQLEDAYNVVVETRFSECLQGK